MRNLPETSAGRGFARRLRAMPGCLLAAALLLPGGYALAQTTPIFISEPVTMVAHGTQYFYSIETADFDGDPVTITVSEPTPLQAWLTFGDNGNGTAQLSGTPSLAEVGNHPIVLEVTDGVGTSQQPFTITVTNNAPAFTSTPVTSVSHSQTYTYNIAAVDADGDPITITAPTLPGWLALTPTGNGTAQLTGDPGQAQIGDHNVVLEVSDTVDTDEQSFVITVTNSAPEFTSTPVTSVRHSETYTYDITAVDADGDSLTITAPTVPGWLDLTDNGNGTAELTGDPGAAQIGSHNVVLRVSDGIDSREQPFTINVTNSAPTFTSAPVTSVNHSDTYTYNITAEDADGDSLTITAPTLPAWLSLNDNGNGTAELTGDPGPAQVGSHNVVLEVSDGVASDEQSFTINVTNNAPAFTSTPVTSVNHSDTYTYDITAEDADGDSLTITAPTRPAWLNLTDNGNGTALLTGTPGAAQTGSHSVVLQVSDGIDSVQQSFTINVTNNAPVFTSTPVTSVNQSQIYAYNVTAEDADNDPLTITAPTLPAWLDFTDNGDGSGLLTGTPDQQDQVGSHSVVLEVSDGINSIQQAFTISVENNPPEQIEEIPPQNATESIPFELDLGEFFMDPNGDPLFYEVDFGEHPVGLPLSGNLELDGDGSKTGVAGRIFGTPDADDTSDDGPRTVTVLVRDRANPGDGWEIEAEFALTVSALDRVDISLAISPTPSPAQVNADVTWEFRVSNASPVVDVDQVAVDAEFSGVPVTFTDPGNCTVNGQTLSCTAGPVPADSDVTLSVIGRPTLAGDVVVAATAEIPDITGFEPVDPNQENNSAVSTLNVGETFSSGPAETLTSPSTSRGVAAGDINGNGFTDLVLATGSGNSTRIYFSEPRFPDEPDAEQFRTLSDSPMRLNDDGFNGQDVLLVDLTNDGALDIVVANGATNNTPQANNVFLNNLIDGQPNFALHATLGNGVSHAVTAADLTGNGFEDLIFANDGPNEVFINLGSGSFAAGTPLGNNDSRAVVVADFDGDLLPDIVFANRDGPSVLYRNLGNGGNGEPAFAEPITIVSEPMVSVQTADFNSDDLPDLVFGRQTAPSSDVPGNPLFVNTSSPGSVQFVAPTQGTLGASPTLRVVPGDVNEDGIADLISLNATGTHQIFRGAGNSAFTLQPQQFSSAAPAGSSIGDFNNNGRPDLAISRNGGIDIFLNDGLGNLGPGDVTPPVIQLLGEPSVELTIGATYTDAGATATDQIDGNLTNRIVVDNPVNTSVVGTYTVTYNVRDLSGNAAAPMTRSVRVVTREAVSGGGGGAVGVLLLIFLALLAVANRRQRRLV